MHLHHRDAADLDLQRMPSAPAVAPDEAGQAIVLASAAARSILAVGGELKSSVCLLSGRAAALSEPLGALTEPDTYRRFVATIARLSTLLGFQPEVVAHDLHPLYLSTLYARRLGLPAVAVQHHHAHVISLMAESGETGPVVGLACDGTGYGTDGAIWGCEVLRCDAAEFVRLAHLAYFPLVGGDHAAIETWRPAAALLRAALGDEGLSRCADRFATLAPGCLDTFRTLLARGINAPHSSSLGRVFDGIAFILGLCDRNTHEAEAAMALEAAAGDAAARPYPYDMRLRGDCVELSLGPVLDGLLRDRAAGMPVGELAARFHESIARMLAAAAVMGCELGGLSTVALSGGCFANRRLLSRVVELLECRGVHVLRHRRVSCGDAGLALGQAVAAAARCEREL